MKKTGSMLKTIILVFAFVTLLRINSTLGTLLLVVYVGYTVVKGRANFYTAMANTKYQKGDLQGALQLLEKAVKGKAVSYRTVVSYGYLLLKSGRIEEAEKVLAQGLQIKLDANAEAYVKSNLALAYWKKGDLDEAIALLEGVYQNVKNSQIYESLGYFYILKGDLEKALAFNQEASDYNDSDKIILDNLAYTYYLKDDIAKAEELYIKLAAMSPNFPEAYYNYGLVLLKKGEKESALEQVKKSLNYEVSMLSTVTKEEIEEKICEIEALLQNSAEVETAVNEIKEEQE